MQRPPPRWRPCTPFWGDLRPSSGGSRRPPRQPRPASPRLPTCSATWPPTPPSSSPRRVQWALASQRRRRSHARQSHSARLPPASRPTSSPPGLTEPSPPRRPPPHPRRLGPRSPDQPRPHGRGRAPCYCALSTTTSVAGRSGTKDWRPCQTWRCSDAPPGPWPIRHSCGARQADGQGGPAR